MDKYDHRTVGEDRMSFYVFDDLRWQQNTVDHRPNAVIYRYDTLVEAISKYRELPSMVKATCLLARVKNLDGLERYRKPTLDQQMENAESHKASPTNSTPSPEKDR